MLLDIYSPHETQTLTTGSGIRIGGTNVHIRVTQSDTYSAQRVVTLTPSNEAKQYIITLNSPLRGSNILWKSSGRTDRAPLVTDWEGTIDSSLTSSAPLGCLIDNNDHSVMGFGLYPGTEEVAVRYGVDEDRASFTVVFTLSRMHHEYQLYIDDAYAPYQETIQRIASFMRPEEPALPIPAIAETPVFSTWTAFLQNINEKDLLAEIPKIQQLGFSCIYLDAGWEGGKGRSFAYSGDWTADPTKFPDLTNTIHTLHEQGLDVVLWWAPLVLGPNCSAYDAHKVDASAFKPGDAANMHILDPRRASVRKYVIQTCQRIFTDYSPAGLKIDFLDEAATNYQNTPAPTGPDDLPDVGQAMSILLHDLRNVFLSLPYTPLIEFREPYSGPSISPFSNVVRACDCPGDAIANRVRVTDERIQSLGRVIQSDMLLWGAEATAAEVCEQFMSVFFAVPQISVRPTNMSEEQYKACQYMLNLWRSNSRIILNGDLSAIAPSLNYPQITVQSNRQQITGIYQNQMVTNIDIPAIDKATVLNATSSTTILIRFTSQQPSKGSVQTFTPTGATYTHSPLKIEDNTIISIEVPAYGVAEINLDTTSADM